MITFKRFLESLSYNSVELEDAIKIINTKCKNAMWMIHANEPIYRGDKTIDNEMAETGFAVVDPTSSSRTSAHTTNHYTIIMDNIPSMASFPKRSKSLIATTYQHKARDFAGGRDPYIVIPFDSTEIGVVNQPDMWDIEIELFGSRPREFERINKLWEAMGMPAENDSWPKWLEFAKECKGPNRSEYLKRIKNAILDCNFNDMLRITTVEDIADNFIEYIYEAYSPKATGVSKCTIADRHDFEQKTEIWIGGPVLMLTMPMWRMIIEHYTNEVEV